MIQTNQNEKEDMYQCQEGAGERINGEILICDSEEGYVKKLAEALLLKKEVTAGVRFCSSQETMEKLLEIGQVQVLLVSDEIPYEARKRAFAGKRMVLTGLHAADLGEEEVELVKYQPADILTAEIMKVFQDSSFPAVCGRNGKGRILGVYSPSHRIGKTTFALKLGRLLAEEENVLYMNLEEYAGIGGYFKEGEVQNLSHLLYYVRQENDDISVRTASLVRQMGSLDYVPPMRVWTDLKDVTLDEWESLLGQLTAKSIYHTVILDIGNAVSDVFGVLGICDRILLLCGDDVYAKAKYTQYQYMLKVLKRQELDAKTVYVDITKNMRQNVKETVAMLSRRPGKERVHAESGTAS